MTIIESNLLMSLFFSQHEGKRLCDVIKGHTNKNVISYMNNKTLSGFKNSDINHTQILWYNLFDKSISYKICSDDENFNILDYISFEDKV